MSYYSYSFTAYDNIGLSYTIDVYLDRISAGSPDNIRSELKELQLYGQAVDYIKQGEYRLMNGTILHSSSPDAP